MKQEQIWSTSVGRDIAVGDMTHEHLKNVLRQLIREKRILPPYIERSAMQKAIQEDIDIVAVPIDDDAEDTQYHTYLAHRGE